jgi:hypothetical protein
VKILMILVALTLSASAHAQINKCVDKSGKVVAYGSDCPAGTTAADSGIRTAPAAAPAVAPAKKSQAEQDADFKKRQQERQDFVAQEQKKAGEDAVRLRACEDSRAYLKGLQSGNRITRTDAKTGERVVLDDAGYPKEIAAAQQSVAANCKG